MDILRFCRKHRKVINFLFGLLLILALELKSLPVQATIYPSDILFRTSATKDCRYKNTATGGSASGFTIVGAHMGCSTIESFNADTTASLTKMKCKVGSNDGRVYQTILGGSRLCVIG